MGGQPPGVETADRIGDCQVQRAGCLIPAVAVAEKGRREVNSSVSRELGISEPHAPGHAVHTCRPPVGIDCLPATACTLETPLWVRGPYCTVQVSTSTTSHSTSCGTQILQP